MTIHHQPHPCILASPGEERTEFDIPITSSAAKTTKRGHRVRKKVASQQDEECHEGDNIWWNKKATRGRMGQQGGIEQKRGGKVNWDGSHQHHLSTPPSLERNQPGWPTTGLKVLLFAFMVPKFSISIYIFWGVFLTAVFF